MSTPPRRQPAYLEIADNVRGMIERGELQPGDRLQTERELVEHYGVARMTVRHALDILQLEGLIDRKRGRTGGTGRAATARTSRPPSPCGARRERGRARRSMAGPGETGTRGIRHSHMNAR